MNTTTPHPKPTLSLTLLLLLWLAIPAGAAQGPLGLTATLEPSVIPFGAQATLQLRFQDCVPQTVPEIPSVPGLQIRYISQGRETTIVNGRMQSAVVFSYLVQPAQAGDYLIPPVRALVDGQPLASQPVTLQVAPTDPQAPQAQPLILTLTFPQSTFYVGEATVATVSLLSRYASQRLLALPVLSVEGAVVGTNVPLATAQTVTTNNAVYRLESWRVPVTFVKTGNLRVSAENCELAVQIRNQRARDPFGFPSLFGDTETRRFTVSSLPVTVSIRPLPSENVPPEFTGAVGRFTLDAAISSTRVAAGDPITLTVRLAGLGNLDALRWSAPSNWIGFRLYEPTGSLESSDALGHTGAKTIEQVAIPESPAVRAIPPIRFAFFDPAQGTFQTLVHPGFALNVSASATPTAQPTIARAADAEGSRRATDIVHIKSRPGQLALTAPPLINHPGFLALFTLPFLAWTLSWFWRRRVDRLAADPRQARRREVARRLNTGRATLRAQAQAGQVQEFHSELFRLLQEILGERLGLPAGSITGEIVTVLRTAQLPTELADEVDQLFAQCDQARYAPDAVTGALQSTLPRAEETLRQLQRLEVSHEA